LARPVLVTLWQNSYRVDGNAAAAALKTVYTAPTVDAAAEALDDFANSTLG
jgi:hypothetical protein